MEFQPTLALSALASSVAAGIFLSAGLELRSRQVGEPGAEEAMNVYSLWWMSLAIYAVAGASLTLTAALGVVALDLFVMLGYAQMISLCIGLWGLVYYVAFVLTGSRGMRVPLAIVYAAYYGILLFVITLGRPILADVTTWSTRLEAAAPVVDTAAGTLLLVLPPLVASCTYFALVFVVESPSQRFRVVLVTLGSATWLAGILAGTAPAEAWWASMPPLLALVSAWAVFWAYRPPAWVLRRLGLLHEAPPTAE